jgi:hypothetical protein
MQEHLKKLTLCATHYCIPAFLVCSLLKDLIKDDILRPCPFRPLQALSPPKMYIASFFVQLSEVDSMATLLQSLIIHHGRDGLAFRGNLDHFIILSDFCRPIHPENIFALADSIDAVSFRKAKPGHV